MSARSYSERAKLAKQQRENLQEQYVNLYRKVHGTNLGLWSKDLMAMPIGQLVDMIACLDMTLKLRETGQIYIVGLDCPLSIAESLFRLLDARRRQEAQARSVPEAQYEFEDLIGLFLGLGVS